MEQEALEVTREVILGKVKSIFLQKLRDQELLDHLEFEGMCQHDPVIFHRLLAWVYHLQDTKKSSKIREFLGTYEMFVRHVISKMM